MSLLAPEVPRSRRSLPAPPSVPEGKRQGGRILTAVVRLVLRLLLRLFYRVRIDGLFNIPEKGGALLVANHVSWLDGLLVLLYAPRPVRMIGYAEYVSGAVLGRLAEEAGVIPLAPGDRRSVLRAVRTAREALRAGEVVCIFPEGELTRSGEIQAFQPGLLTILKETAAPLVPVYLGGLWGSIFSFERGRFFWKRPRQVPYPVTIRVGRPCREVRDAEQVRQAVLRLKDETMKRCDGSLAPPRQFLRMCRRCLRKLKAADSTRAELTGAGLLTRTLAVRRLLRRELLQADEAYVGVLLPPSVGGLVVNAALAIDRRVAVNLNYTVSSEVMNLSIARCGIRRVLTSRRVLERFPLKIEAELVFVEDLRDRLSRWDKLVAASQAWLWPAALLERHLGLHRLDPEDVLTVIFTSGSTGDPKGVMLTQRNIAANIEAFREVLHFRDDDVVVGVLPFFHSFGYTTTLWTTLVMDTLGVFHFSPLDYRPVGALCRKYRGTVMVNTPTFLRTYLRRCEPEELSSLEMLVAGAEKLPPELADAFEQKFGVRPQEGYGTTELSPVVATNIPPARQLPGENADRMGTVGRPLPGVRAKITDLDTGAELGPGRSGMLWIGGHGVMKGYLHQPEETAAVLCDGWYKTGDIAERDADGFLRITGRLSRFSKIGGEMVPHLRIEELLVNLLGWEEEEIRLAVTAVPDSRKGERIVVLHTGLERTPEQLCRELGARGLPPIWLPAPDSFLQVEAIPLLGSGKLNLRALRQLAEARFGVAG